MMQKKMKCFVSQIEKKGIWVNPRRKVELFELYKQLRMPKKKIKIVGIGLEFPNDLKKGGWGSMGKTPL